MQNFFETHKQTLDRLAFFAVITLIVWLFFTVFFGLLAPFFFGLIIAVIMEPLIRLMVNRFKWKRGIASILCVLLFLAIMGSIGVWIILTLIRQVTTFVASTDENVGEILSAAGTAATDLLARVEAMLPETWTMPDMQEIITPAITSLFDGGFGQVVDIATAVPNFFIGIILALVSSYFFMADRRLIFATIRKSCPKWLVGHMSETRAGLSRAVGGYIRAQYILMTMVGIISIVGLLILRSPFALLMGLIMAALDFLPILGPAIIIVPWVIISLLAGDTHMAIGLGVIYGVITITRQVLQPKILGDQMGAHPLASLMSMFIGLRVFGLLGLIIGPSLLMIFIAIRERGSEDIDSMHIDEPQMLLNEAHAESEKVE